MAFRRNHAIIFMWEQFAAYHVDRLEAVSTAFGDRYAIVGIEVASKSLTYAWAPVTSSSAFRRVTLFPDAVCENVAWPLKLWRSMRSILAARPYAVFLCNQEHPEILAAALLLRMLGVRIIAMLDAKFDDSERHVLKESLKRIVLSLYSGAIVAGARSLSYYRFLGMREGWAQPAYDTVSIARLRRDALLAPDVPEKTHGDRDFLIVARFVPKKNIAMAIRAYERFLRLDTKRERVPRLVLCGSGPLEAPLRDLVSELLIDRHVSFAGFLSHEQVSQRLCGCLALLVPSVEEQWGLVINEALAMGIPVLCSDNVGARDTLVRVGVNGFVFEPDNEDGLARLMHLLADDEKLWREMADGSRRLAPAGDVKEFTAGVAKLLSITEARTR